MRTEMRRGRRWAGGLALLLVTAMLLCACSAGQGWEKEEKPERIKIGVNFSYSGNMTFIEMVQAMQARAEELGNVELMISYSEMDPIKIVSDIETFINAGCQAIIVQNFDVVACEAVLKQAKEAGIYVLTYDEVSAHADASMIVDNVELGRLIARMTCDWIEENLDGRAQVGILSISSYSFLETRMDAVAEAVSAFSPDSQVVARASAYTVDTVDTVETLLQANPDINVLITYHDNSGLFAAEAMKIAAEANGWDMSKRAVFGCDCTQAGMDAIASGSMYRGSIFLDNRGKIVELMDRAIGLVEGRRYDSKLIYFDMEAVTAQNIEEYR